MTVKTEIAAPERPADPRSGRRAMRAAAGRHSGSGMIVNAPSTMTCWLKVEPKQDKRAPERERKQARSRACELEQVPPRNGDAAAELRVVGGNFNPHGGKQVPGPERNRERCRQVTGPASADLGGRSVTQLAWENAAMAGEGG